MLKVLSEHNYDLQILKELCKKERAWFQSVDADDFRRLFQDHRDERAKQKAEELIKLSDRSDTVYARVKEVSAMGRTTFLARVRATELIPLVVEAGYDLAAIKTIASSSCEANGWTADDVAEAVSVLAKNNTAMTAIIEQAKELVVLCVQNADAATILNEVLEIGMEALANVVGLGEVVAEIAAIFF